MNQKWTERYEERAGILQFDARMSREDAERVAMEMTLKEMRR